MSALLRMIGAALVLLIPTTWRLLVWVLDIQFAQIYPEFRSVLVVAPDVAMGLFLLLTLLRLGIDRDWRKHLLNRLGNLSGNLWPPFWIFLVSWALFSAIWSAAPWITLYDAIRLMAGIVLALFIAAEPDNRSQRIWLWALVWGAVFQSIIGLGQVITGGRLGLDVLGELTISQARAYGLSVNPNNLAGYLLVALFAGWTLRTQSVSRCWLVLPLSIIMLGLIATGSKTAIGALVLVSAIWGFRQFGDYPRLRWYGTLTLILLLIGVALVALIDPTVANRLIFEFDPTYAVIRVYPLQGAGMGQVLIAAYAQTQAWYRILLPAHNTYLVVWAELGLIGLALYCAAIWQTLRLTLFRNPTRSIFIFGLSLLAISAVGLFDYYFWSDPRSQILFFIDIGLVWQQIVREHSAPFVPPSRHSPPKHTL